MYAFITTIRCWYRPWRRELIALHLLVVAGTAVIIAFNLDLRIAAFFYKPTPGSAPWPYMEFGPVLFMYRFGEWPALFVAIAALIVLIAGIRAVRWRIYRRESLFLLLVFAVGPGLLVNTIFKEYWGRPRPVQVCQFGGALDFKPLLVMGTPGQGKSFPSGHASAAFFLAAGYCIWRTGRRRLAEATFAAGMLYGILVGITRMARGGHFLSDILWALYFTWLAALLLAPLLDRAMFPRQAHPDEAPA